MKQIFSFIKHLQSLQILCKGILLTKDGNTGVFNSLLKVDLRCCVQLSGLTK